MKRLLLLPLILNLVSPVQAAVDAEVHKLCLQAVDYKGCVDVQENAVKKEVQRKPFAFLDRFRIKKENSVEQYLKDAAIHRELKNYKEAMNACENALTHDVYGFSADAFFCRGLTYFLAANEEENVFLFDYDSELANADAWGYKYQPSTRWIKSNISFLKKDYVCYMQMKAAAAYEFGDYECDNKHLNYYGSPYGSLKDSYTTLAVKDFTRAIQLNPDNLDFKHFNLSSCYDLDQAFAGRHIRKHPQDIEWVDTIEWVEKYITALRRVGCRGDF